jgi:hypothetical protein
MNRFSFLADAEQWPFSKNKINLIWSQWQPCFAGEGDRLHSTRSQISNIFSNAPSAIRHWDSLCLVNVL